MATASIVYELGSHCTSKTVRSLPKASSIKSTDSLDTTLPNLLRVTTSTSLMPAIARKQAFVGLNFTCRAAKDS